MVDDSYRNLCIFHILDGLRFGLSHYSQPSRTALIYAVSADDPLRVYDPQNLLRGHEPVLKSKFLESDEWRTTAQAIPYIPLYEQARTRCLDLSGLICHASRSRSVFCQTWFTEHHPSMCSTGPTERWMEHGAWLMSQCMSTENVPILETAGNVLQNFALHAIRNYIVDQRSAEIGMDTRLRVYPILDAVLGISKTPEEGVWPRGRLAFVEPSQMDKVRFLARFPEQERPRLEHFKHVRKLLQAAEQTGRSLVSDGQAIVGIAIGRMPGSRIVAEFSGSYGFLRLGAETVCSFTDGAFDSSNRQANLVHFEEFLLETGMDFTERNSLFKIVSAIVHHSQEGRHGSTLVLDFRSTPEALAGQHLEVPLDLEQPHLLSLAQALSKVDGALHIGGDRKLHGFACLLDGLSVGGEDRARGARYNSALRFTSGRDDTVVIVVSSDRPVSIIQNGVEISATCMLPPKYACVDTPPLLKDWLQA
ncbi:MAG: DNA integrity scanning protein DisA nucleotide-binding domain protein [Proteobacteria bacterium]|nr:DNA integrity scanning protein DisA nucleotide-binding domain protein [Pseudomonadota bacterium]